MAAVALVAAMVILPLDRWARSIERQTAAIRTGMSIKCDEGSAKSPIMLGRVDDVSHEQFD